MSALPSCWKVPLKRFILHMAGVPLHPLLSCIFGLKAENLVQCCGLHISVQLDPACFSYRINYSHVAPTRQCFFGLSFKSAQILTDMYSHFHLVIRGSIESVTKVINLLPKTTEFCFQSLVLD